MEKLFNKRQYSLEWIIKKVHQLRKVDQLLKKILDQRLVPHCKVANYENDCLVICVDNPSSATLLRFQSPELIEELRQYPELENLSAIKCHIENKDERRVRNVHAVFPVSQETVGEIKELMKGLLNIKLQKSIDRLVKHFEKK